MKNKKEDTMFLQVLMSDFLWVEEKTPCFSNLVIGEWEVKPVEEMRPKNKSKGSHDSFWFSKKVG